MIIVTVIDRFIKEKSNSYGTLYILKLFRTLNSLPCKDPEASNAADFLPALASPKPPGLLKQRKEGMEWYLRDWQIRGFAKGFNPRTRPKYNRHGMEILLNRALL